LRIVEQDLYHIIEYDKIPKNSKMGQKAWILGLLVFPDKRSGVACLGVLGV
jgi:hypothetical protein